MKTLLKGILLITICGLASQTMAQSVQIGSASGLPGATVSIPVTFTSGPSPDRDVTAIQLILLFADTYDLVESTEVAPSCGGDPAIDPLAAELCGWGGAGSPNYQIQQVKATAYPTAVIARINFTIPGSAVPGTVDTVSVQQFLIGGAAGALDPPPEIVSGTITVDSGPQPDWSSTPDSTTGFDFGSHTTETGAFQLDLVVTNAGAAGSTLTGTCDVTGSSVFSISGNNTLGAGLAMDASDTITVQCDTTGAAVQPHTGTMSCTHDGDGNTETSITDYALGCNVTATPEPAYSDALSPDPLALVAVEEGDNNPTGTITVTNNGEVDTTLIGTCSYSGDPAMSLSSGNFSLAKNASTVVTLTCDASTESPSPYTGTVSCTHNANNTPSPVIHDATCVVGPPGDAVYSSVKAPNGVYDLTPPGDPVPVETTIPTQDLVITNDAPEANDRDLALLNCGLSGVGPITATAASTPLAPNASTTVTFSCDSTTAGDYTETYSCPYDVDGDGTADGTASYTVNCGVRLAASEVTETPVSGTALTMYVPFGGVGQASVVFDEVLDEGESGSLNNCALDDDTYFSIVAPASFPQTITSGGSVEVLVEGMGTDDGLPTTAMLTCDYTDSQNESTTVSWPLDVVVLAAGIPTLSTWGLMLMILTLLGLGGLVIRRKDLS